MEADLGVVCAQAKDIRVVGGHWKLGERPEADCPSEAPERPDAARPWISDFWPPDVGEMTFLLC